MNTEFKDYQDMNNDELLAYYDELYDMQSELDQDTDFDEYDRVGLEMSWVEEEMEERGL